MADKKRKTRSKGVSFDPPELQTRMKSAFSLLFDILSHDWYPLESPDFKPDEHDDATITETSLVEGVSLPSMQEYCDVPVSTILRWADEIKHGKVIDRKEYRSPTLTLVYISPASGLAQIAQDSLSRRLGNLAQDVVVEGNTYRLELIQGLTLFGIKIAQEGNYEDYAPPCELHNCFIQVTHSQRNEAVIQSLVDALLYELDATLGLAFTRSTLLEPGDEWAEEAGEKLDEQIPEGTARLRPILHGAGIAELLSLFNEASTVGSAEYAVLGFTKVIEYVSATVVKQQSHHAIRTRLLSPEALRPDAKFIDGLLALTEDQRVFQKDSEAIRLSVETCCDATQLALLAPACIASLKKVSEHSKAEDKRDGLRKLAECLSSTRNQIVHAKTNFNPKGAECPESQMDALRACARMAAQQVIRWFSDVPESFRVLKSTP